MVNMTMAIPEDLEKAMKTHVEVKWSEVARKAMWEHAKKLEFMDKVLKNSKLTEKDADDIAQLINKNIAKKHKV